VLRSERIMVIASGSVSGIHKVEMV
jgi:hypothetical protein